MRKSSFKLNEKASVSLVSVIRRKTKRLPPTSAARAAGFSGQNATVVQKDDKVALLVQAPKPNQFTAALPNLAADEQINSLAEGFFSAHVHIDTAEELLKLPSVQRLQSKKQSVPFLKDATIDVGLRTTPTGARQTTETGKDVLIGIVDSGFDLSHPMFRDASGKLRVAGLLDQQDNNKQFTTAQLTTAWNTGGTKPGKDQDGHGTHVATIAGGTKFGGFEGVAPEARFLLVRTDYYNTDDAVSWIVQKAGNKPCVINLSLGHHFGAHDGTDAEERLHEQLVGPGKIIVCAAGNEREDNLHLGGSFTVGQTQTVTFDVLRQRDHSAPRATITLWFSDQDDFNITLITPSGQQLDVPTLGNADQYQSSSLDIELSRKSYAWSNLHQVQITLGFSSPQVANALLNRWKVRLTCRTAVVGRLDGWVHNSGFARFRDHGFVENSRTIGLAATGKGCIAVASHVTKNAWTADIGASNDSLAVVGRSSSFSSQGPTRDGRWKPEISAPGQYLTAALADSSDMAGIDERAEVNARLLTIEGTSMAAPMVTGIIALLLQKKRSLTPDKIRTILQASARHDQHTGPANWNPSYGFGKIDVIKALAGVS